MKYINIINTWLWNIYLKHFNDEIYMLNLQEKLSPEYIYYIEDMAAYYNMKEDCKPL